MSNGFFPPRPKSRPTIYAYEDTNPQYAGLLKVGYTTVDAKSRVAQQYPTLRPGKPPYRIVLEEPAMRNDGTTFTDHHVHSMLRINGVKNEGGEWFRCTTEQVKAAIVAVRTGQLNEENRSLDFAMRPEQEAAVEKTAAYFKSFRKENHDKPPHFLWNAKPRELSKTISVHSRALADDKNGVHSRIRSSSPGGATSPALARDQGPAVRSFGTDAVQDGVGTRGRRFQAIILTSRSASARIVFTPPSGATEELY